MSKMIFGGNKKAIIFVNERRPVPGGSLISGLHLTKALSTSFLFFVPNSVSTSNSSTFAPLSVVLLEGLPRSFLTRSMEGGFPYVLPGLVTGKRLDSADKFNPYDHNLPDLLISQIDYMLKSHEVTRSTDIPQHNFLIPTLSEALTGSLVAGVQVDVSDLARVLANPPRSSTVKSSTPSSTRTAPTTSRSPVSTTVPSRVGVSGGTTSTSTPRPLFTPAPAPPSESSAELDARLAQADLDRKLFHTKKPKSSDWVPRVAIPFPDSVNSVNNPGYVRIGYVAFSVDSVAKQISVKSSIPFSQKYTLRSSSPIQRGISYSAKQVNISITVSTVDALNKVILPLLRMFRRAPIQPVVCNFLNDQNIFSLALEDFSLNTIEGFPNSLEVNLTCWSFNDSHIILGSPTLDSKFCYPLLVLWLESSKNNVSLNKTFTGNWTGFFNLTHFDQEFLSKSSERNANLSRSQAYNAAREDISALRAISDSDHPLNYYGFRNTTEPVKPSTGLSLEAFGLPSYIYILDENYGYAKDELGAKRYFLKIRSQEALKIILDKYGSGITIYQGPVKHSTQYLDPSVGIYTYNIIGTIIDNSLFIRNLDRLINNNLPDPAFRTGISSGNYTLSINKATLDAISNDSSLNKELFSAEDIDTSIKYSESSFNIIGDRVLATIESVSCSVQNTFGSYQIRSDNEPTFQYMGGSSATFSVQGILPNGSDVTHLVDFLTRVNELSREYPGSIPGIVDTSLFGGSIKVENDIINSLGINYVLPISFSTSTVEGFPDAIRFSLVITEFDSTQRNRELLVSINKDIIKERGTVTTDPILSSVKDSIGTHALRQSELDKKLRGLELYPDLSLPTHKTISKWVEDISNGNVWDFKTDRPKKDYDFLDPLKGGIGWYWATSAEIGDANKKSLPVLELTDRVLSRLNGPDNLDRFAEPDFYCSAALNYGTNLVDDLVASTTGGKLVFQDRFGTSAETPIGSTITDFLNAPEHWTDPMGTYDQAKDSLAETLKGSAGNKDVAVLPRGSRKIFTDILHNLDVDPSNPDYALPHIPNELGSGIAASYPGGTIGSIPESSVLRKAAADFSNIIAGTNDGSKEARHDYYANTIIQAAKIMGVEAGLLSALIDRESAFRFNARNPGSSATGLGQFLTRTAAGLDKLFQPPVPTGTSQTNPGLSILYAAYYLRKSIDIFGSIELGIAGYHEGHNSASLKRGIIPEGLKSYVSDILALRTKYNSKLGTTGPSVYHTEAARKVYESATWARQLRTELAAGKLFLDKQIVPHIIPTDNIVKGDKFIKPEWLRTITIRGGAGTSSYYGSVATDIRFGIEPRFLDLFINSAITVGFRQLPGALPVDRTESEVAAEVLRNQTELDSLPTKASDSFYDPVTESDALYDMRRELNMSGRLLSAYPTFYVALVNGGSTLRLWKIYDQVYGLFAITNISVHRTREGPVETAEVAVSNMFQHLTAYVNELDKLQNTFNPLTDLNTGDIGSILNLSLLSNLYMQFFTFTEDMIQAWAQEISSFVLKPGARLHIRLGYGSDASELPVVFNGTITEVPLDEGEVHIVALSDGLELLNSLQPNASLGTMPVSRYNSFLGTGMNPRSLIMQFLDPTGLGLKNLISNSVSLAVGDAFPLLQPSFRNGYGIEHFGFPYKKFLSTTEGELGINIYDPTYSTPVNKYSGAFDTEYDSIRSVFGTVGWKRATQLIGVQLSGARPWDIFDTCTRAVPGYILYPLPVNFRHTLFYGKNWFPVYTDYKPSFDFIGIDGDPNAQREKYFYRKTFQQAHICASTYNIVANNVKGDSTHVYTQVQALGTVNGWLPSSLDMASEASFVMQADSDIRPEFQRLRIVESGLYTTLAMKLGELQSSRIAGAVALGGAGIVLAAIIIAATGAVGIAALTLGAFLAGAASEVVGAVKPVSQFFQSRRVLDWYAMSILKDSLKTMYSGQLVIQGSGWIKPYDICAINDEPSRLNGCCEVREIVHTFSPETGFLTSITPDCLVHTIDLASETTHYNILSLSTSFGIYYGLHRLSTHILFRALPRGLLRNFTNAVLTYKLQGAGSFINSSGLSVPDLETNLSKSEETLESLRKRRNLDDFRNIRSRITDDILAEAESNVEKAAQALDDLRLNPNSFSADDIAFLDESLEDLRKLSNNRDAFTVKYRSIISDPRYTPILKKLQQLKHFDILQDNAAVTFFEHYAKMSNADLSALAKSKASLLGNYLKAGATKFMTPVAPTIATARTYIAGTKVGSALASGAAKVSARFGAIAANQVVSKVGTLALGSVGSIGAGFVVGLANDLANLAARWSVSRQAVIIYPLRIGTKEFTAGINGHRGAVVGDNLGILDKIIDWFADTGNRNENPFVGTAIEIALPMWFEFGQHHIRYRRDDTASNNANTINSNLRLADFEYFDPETDTDSQANIPAIPLSVNTGATRVSALVPLDFRRETDAIEV